MTGWSGWTIKTNSNFNRHKPLTVYPSLVFSILLTLKCLSKGVYYLGIELFAPLGPVRGRNLFCGGAQLRVNIEKRAAQRRKFTLAFVTMYHLTQCLPIHFLCYGFLGKRPHGDSNLTRHPLRYGPKRGDSFSNKIVFTQIV